MNRLTYGILTKGPSQGKPGAILNLASINLDAEFFLSQLPKFSTKYHHQWRPFGALILYVIPDQDLLNELSPFIIEVTKLFGDVVIEVSSSFYVPESATLAFTNIQNEIKFLPKKSYLQYDLAVDEKLPVWTLDSIHPIYVSPKIETEQNIEYVEEYCLQNNVFLNRVK